MARRRSKSSTRGSRQRKRERAGRADTHLRVVEYGEMPDLIVGGKLVGSSMRSQPLARLVNPEAGSIETTGRETRLLIANARHAARAQDRRMREEQRKAQSIQAARSAAQ